MNDQQHSSADARTYITQPGESVAGIALRQCGSEDEWRNIIALNPEFSEHTACDYFPVGTVLTLPPLPVSQPAAAPKFNKQKMLASAREHGMDLGDNPVAYEFYNKATGHAVVDYTRWTHRGHLTEKDGYEARPLAYANAEMAQPAAAPIADAACKLPTMRKAFRVTEVSGDPDPAKQSFAMRFSFPSIEALHAADDEWNKFTASAPSPADERDKR